MPVNFSAVNGASGLGRWLRLPLRLLPRGLAVPVLQGPLRGARWIVGSASHGCWLGSYELDMQRTFQAVIHEGSVVYDIGANAGFFTLMAARLAGPSGRVFAFEPAPRNCRFIRKHVGMNRCQNVSVFEMAVSSADGEAFFDSGADATQGHLSNQGSLKVATVTIDSLVYQRSMPAPNVIKIDVEGAEADVLQGARQTLRQHRPTILLATHSFEARQECRKTLDDCGFEVSSLQSLPEDQSSELIARPRLTPLVGSNR